MTKGAGHPASVRRPVTASVRCSGAGVEAVGKAAAPLWQPAREARIASALPQKWLDCR